MNLNKKLDKLNLNKNGSCDSKKSSDCSDFNIPQKFNNNTVNENYNNDWKD